MVRRDAALALLERAALRCEIRMKLLNLRLAKFKRHRSCRLNRLFRPAQLALRTSFPSVWAAGSKVAQRVAKGDCPMVSPPCQQGFNAATNTKLTGKLREPLARLMVMMRSSQSRMKLVGVGIILDLFPINFYPKQVH